MGQANIPPITIYITNTGTGELGQFFLPVDHGPVAGKYRVEIRQDATRWTSNSRDPFIIRMMARQSQNALSEEDLEAWTSFIRTRNLSPSLYDQRVFLRQHPNDKQKYIVEIKEGKKLMLQIFSK